MAEKRECEQRSESVGGREWEVREKALNRSRRGRMEKSVMSECNVYDEGRHATIWRGG